MFDQEFYLTNHWQYLKIGELELRILTPDPYAGNWHETL